MDGEEWGRKMRSQMWNRKTFSGLLAPQAERVVGRRGGRQQQEQDTHSNHSYFPLGPLLPLPMNDAGQKTSRGWLMPVYASFILGKSVVAMSRSLKCFSSQPLSLFANVMHIFASWNCVSRHTFWPILLIWTCCVLRSLSRFLFNKPWPRQLQCVLCRMPPQRHIKKGRHLC